VPRTYADWFRAAAVAEACSWALLLLGMLLKYGFGHPAAVMVAGWIHGLLFTAYLVTCLVVFSPMRWRPWVLLLALVASVPPLATVLFERWVARRGLTEIPASPEPTFWGRVGYVLRELN